MRDTLRAEMMDWIGHELKTPVQSLGLASDLLNRQREDVDDSLGILIDTVRQDTERLRAVVRQFMDIAGMTPAMLRLYRARGAGRETGRVAGSISSDGQGEGAGTGSDAG